MPFTCSICGEESTQICARCTKAACDNHICEKCLRCSDCCECEMRIAEPLRMMVHPPARAAAESEPDPDPEPHAPIPGPDPDPSPEPAEAAASAMGGVIIPGPGPDPDPGLPEPDPDPVPIHREGPTTFSKASSTRAGGIRAPMPAGLSRLSHPTSTRSARGRSRRKSHY